MSVQSPALGVSIPIDEGKIRKTALADGITGLSVGIVVPRRRKLLLVRRIASDFLGGMYELPGGRVAPDEPLPATVIREAEEETGLVVTRIRRYFRAFDYQAGSGTIRQYNFLVSVKPGKVCLDNREHDRFVWVEYAGLGKFPMTGEMLASVKKAFRMYETL